jgi:hypothetical protein
MFPSSLNRFARQFVGIVLAGLIPVVLTAFLTIPFNLGAHPGEERSFDPMTSRHMT